ncbi:MAG: aminotransferase class I/II-fold pyridoxal phosphate-dependent enzyme [Candidatus Nanopelagicales bacterium]
MAPLGPHVDAFEAEIAEAAGAPHAVALSSGTAALHLALLGIGVRPGDEVVVPTMTFGATAFAVTYAGATPVFVDSEPQSWNLDPQLLDEWLAGRAAQGRLPAAVIVVDVFGQTADYARLVETCARFDVPLVEDAAEALGSAHDLGPAGSFGRAAIFSFNGNKIMTTSGGGMLVTDDEQLASRARYLSTQARQPVAWYEHEDIGFNYRMSNVLAALGRAQLSRLPGMIDVRRAHHRTYTDLLSPAGVDVVADAPWSRGNAWLTVAVLSDPGAPDRIRARLAEQGVEARPVWKPMHAQPVFASAERVLNGNADRLFAHGLCLPSGSAMASSDAELVADVILRELEVS